MKKITLILFLFIYASNLHAQDGTLDTTFGTNGIKVVPLMDYLSDMTTDSNGKLIILGGQNSNIMIYRYNLDGTLDTNFDSDGAKEIDLGADFSIGSSVAVDANDNIIIATNFYGKLVKLNALDGTFDTTFGTSGIATYLSDYDKFVKVAVDYNDKIVVCSYQFSSCCVNKIQRFNSNGTIDTSFNSGNEVQYIYGFSEPSRVNGLQIQDDNKIIVSVTETNNVPFSHGIKRFNTNGTEDTTFTTGSTGVATTGYFNGIFYDGSNLFGLASNPSSSVNSTATVIKYNSNGTKDTSFDSDGILNFIFNTQYNNNPYSICFQPNGKPIIVASTRVQSTASNSNIALTRLNLDGTTDTTFGTNGITLVGLNTPNLNKSWSVLNYINGKVYTLIFNGTSIGLYRFNTGIILSNTSFSNAEKITIVPNPTSNYLNIDSEKEIKSINVIDVAGRVTSIKNFTNNKIDVSNLSNGIYFIEVQTNDGAFKSKFIKN